MEVTLQLNTVPTFLIATSEVEKHIKNYLYYAENVRGMAFTTLKSRRIYLGQFSAYLEASNIEDISLLTQMQLDMYFVYMKNRTSVRGRPISTGTVNTSKRAVKAFLVWCDVYSGISLKVKPSEIRELRREDKHPKILTHDEIIQVVRRIRVKQDKLMISVMYEAGLRISEVADLRIEHLRGKVLDVVGKGSKHRITCVNPKLAQQLHNWMAENDWTEGHVFRPIQHGDGGGYTHTDTIRQRIKTHFMKELGKDMHPHQLRHSFALRLLKNGCDLRTIQKMLGHSKIETTMAYLNIEDEHLEKEHARSFRQTVYA